MTMTVKTNNVPRPLLNTTDLTDAEHREVGMPDDEAGGSFFRYRGHVWDLSDFPRLDNGLTGDGGPWQAAQALTVWSGVVIRLVQVDGDTMVVVGTYSE